MSVAGQSFSGREAATEGPPFPLPNDVGLRPRHALEFGHTLSERRFDLLAQGRGHAGLGVYIGWSQGVTGIPAGSKFLFGIWNGSGYAAFGQAAEARGTCELAQPQPERPRNMPKVECIPRRLRTQLSPAAVAPMCDLSQHPPGLQSWCREGVGKAKRARLAEEAQLGLKGGRGSPRRFRSEPALWRVARWSLGGRLVE